MNPDAQTEAGVLAAHRGDEDAERWLVAAARRGRPDAANALAEMYGRQGQFTHAATWARRGKLLAEAKAETKRE